ncbi:MAG: hypothetical protein AB7F86_10200 [Bdellovibrionales bacterium]
MNRATAISVTGSMLLGALLVWQIAQVYFESRPSCRDLVRHCQKAGVLESRGNRREEFRQLCFRPAVTTGQVAGFIVDKGVIEKCRMAIGTKIRQKSKAR